MQYNPVSFFTADPLPQATVPPELPLQHFEPQNDNNPVAIVGGGHHSGAL